MLWVTASTCKNRNKTITNRLEHWKVPNIVRMENTRTETITNRLESEKTEHIGAIKEGFKPCDDFEFMGDDEVGIPYQQTGSMTGKDIRDIRDSRVHDIYVNGYYICSEETKSCKARNEMESTYKSLQGRKRIQA